MSEASLSPIERYCHFHLDNFFFLKKFFLHYIALVGAPIGRPKNAKAYTFRTSFMGINPLFSKLTFKIEEVLNQNRSNLGK